MTYIATTDEALLDSIHSSESLSQKTKEIYASTLRVLQELCEGLHGDSEEFPSLGWIACNPKPVIQLLFKTYDNNNTRRRFIASVKSLFKYNSELSERYPECNKVWKKAMEMLDDVYRNQATSAQLTERERKNWVPWDKILEREKYLSKHEYGGFDHLLLAMYCLIEPLRQNFGNVRIFIREAPSETSEMNYIVMLGKHRANLVLNDYKTSKKYGTFERSLPETLVRVIEASLTSYPRKYLFVNFSDEPYVNQNSFTQYSNRTLFRIFGVRITVSILRHSFISSINFNEELPSALFQKAKNMAHSIGMQQQYRKRAPVEEDIKEAEKRIVRNDMISKRTSEGERIVVIRI